MRTTEAYKVIKNALYHLNDMVGLLLRPHVGNMVNTTGWGGPGAHHNQAHRPACYDPRNSCYAQASLLSKR